MVEAVFASDIQRAGVLAIALLNAARLGKLCTERIGGHDVAGLALDVECMRALR